MGGAGGGIRKSKTGKGQSGDAEHQHNDTNYTCPHASPCQRRVGRTVDAPGVLVCLLHKNIFINKVDEDQRRRREERQQKNSLDTHSPFQPPGPNELPALLITNSLCIISLPSTTLLKR